MGTHGNSGFLSHFIGSNASKVIHSSKVPVLTIQEHIKKIGFSKIVLPIDSSRHSRDKVGIAAGMAEKYGAEIHVLGCVTPLHEEELGLMNVRIKQVETFLDKHEIIYKSVIKHGNNLAKMSMGFSQEINADLLVIMTEQESTPGLFMGPFAQQIVNHSQIPVLSITPLNVYNKAGTNSAV